MSSQLSLTFRAERQVFRVSELNESLQRTLEQNFQGVWVAGEIAGCRAAPSGHYYFCLKERDNQLKAVLFRGNARFVRFLPKDGMSVIARGNLEIYPQRGEYQLVVDALEPMGAGALQLAFEQLKKKLAAEGLFDSARKRPLPKFPRRIGIVTSPSGAVIRDILNVLGRRFPGLHLRLYPAQVQGEFAIGQICEALSYFSANAWAEVVILARGGGSIEDLCAFNEEAVARAIAACAVPVISGVGHETDTTIADFVADLRAPTPSAAAELVICTKESLIDQFNTFDRRALQAVRYRIVRASRELHTKGTDRASAILHRQISRHAMRVDDLDSRSVAAVRRRLEANRRRLADLSHRLAQCDVRVRAAQARHRLELLARRLREIMPQKLKAAHVAHDRLRLHLEQLSPTTILARGYAIVQDANGRVIRSEAETNPGDRLRIRLHQGVVDARVTNP